LITHRGVNEKIKRLSLAEPAEDAENYEEEKTCRLMANAALIAGYSLPSSLWRVAR
jgi:hypothetical protein